MEKIYGLCQIVGPGEWTQSAAIMQKGQVIGFIIRVRTRSGTWTKTLNLQGDVVQGECLVWLLQQSA
jgi:hypothetical protein